MTRDRIELGVELGFRRLAHIDAGALRLTINEAQESVVHNLRMLTPQRAARETQKSRVDRVMELLRLCVPPGVTSFRVEAKRLGFQVAWGTPALKHLDTGDYYGPYDAHSDYGWITHDEGLTVFTMAAQDLLHPVREELIDLAKAQHADPDSTTSNPERPGGRDVSARIVESSNQARLCARAKDIIDSAAGPGHLVTVWANASEPAAFAVQHRDHGLSDRWYVNPWEELTEDTPVNSKGIGRHSELNCAPDYILARLSREDRYELQGLVTLLRGVPLLDAVVKVFVERLPEVDAKITALEAPGGRVSVGWGNPAGRSDDNTWQQWDYGAVVPWGSLRGFDPPVTDRFKPRHMAELRGLLHLHSYDPPADTSSAEVNYQEADPSEALEVLIHARVSTILFSRCMEHAPYVVSTWGELHGAKALKVKAKDAPTFWVNPWRERYGKRGRGSTPEVNCITPAILHSLRRRDRYELQGLLARLNGESIQDGIRRVFSDATGLDAGRITVRRAAHIEEHDQPQPWHVAWFVHFTGGCGYVCHNGSLSMFGDEARRQVKPRHQAELKAVTIGSLWGSIRPEGEAS